MKKITFEQAIEEYLEYVKFKNKQTSHRNIANRINNHILPYFKNKYIQDLSKKDYLNWQIEIDKLNYKIKYKKTLHVCFVTFLNYCMNYYDLNENIASKVGNFHNNNYEQNNGSIWTLEEFNQFINVVDNPTYNILFKLLFFTGLRMGEALALTFNDIDFENNNIIVNKTITRFFENDTRIITNPKTKSSQRKICIDNILKNELYTLQEYYILNNLNYSDNYYVFGGTKSIPPTTLTRYKNKYCAIAGVKQIKIHEFRHSHACLLFMNNVPIDEISYRLGHSTISMTSDIYLKYLPKNEKRVLSTLNSLRLN